MKKLKPKQKYYHWYIDGTGKMEKETSIWKDLSRDNQMLEIGNCFTDYVLFIDSKKIVEKTLRGMK